MQRTQGGRDRNVRTVFLSDVHLGSRHSQCEELLHYLEDLTPRHLYIVGDLIDGWQLKRSKQDRVNTYGSFSIADFTAA